MVLEKYNKKRDFKQTAEPEGKVKGSKGKVIYMIQKHQATALHFDFRLEVNGVLKSWAVPKGPPINSKERHLAMMVEDHPYDYKDFEGTIPEGNYGAGTVMLWDEGTYNIPELPPGSGMPDGLKVEKDPEKIQEQIEEMIKKGAIKLELHGKKLHGKFAFVRFKRAGENAWLMIKDKDEFEGKALKNEDLSVKTGRTLDEITKNAKHKNITFDQEDPNHPTDSKDSDSGRSKTSKKKDEPPIELLDQQSEVQDKVSKVIKPMLATLVDEPFNNPDWVFEIKWDGYRAIANVNSKTELISRNSILLNKDYPPIIEDLKKLKEEMILDGEITVIDEKGVSGFQLLQNYRRYGEGNLVYYVFDILNYKGKDLTSLEFVERRKILKNVLKESAHIKISDFIEENGEEFFALAEKKGLEGIIAKKKDSIYEEGSRSDHWLKIKSVDEQEVVIGGYTYPEGLRKHFGSLLMGVFKRGKFKYIGHTGSGFNEKSLLEIKEKLDKYKTDESPFEDVPDSELKNVAQWVKPKILAEVKFHGWTESGYMRQAIFLGLREDKKATTVKKETPKSTKEVVE